MFTEGEPIVRSIQSWNRGMLRVNKIADAERRAGFSVTTTGMYSDGVDILVHKNGKLVRVYESTNYGKPEFYIQPIRAKRYRDNLLQYHAEKILVCSYEENLEKIHGGRKYFEQHGIKVQVRGYQD